MSLSLLLSSLLLLSSWSVFSIVTVAFSSPIAITFSPRLVAVIIALRVCPLLRLELLCSAAWVGLTAGLEKECAGGALPTEITPCTLGYWSKGAGGAG
ncbi:hypothetical protein EV702DRAFT_1112861 [Suillus placidus]|uniref:Secreted protein n=1 Tax=Suillus placidus TaxID=48579 RepID=A0A9P6ZT87_9AGAM|nr:hypothetical protein EV702DRAFT_1112861 [Suillus placidus]